jgi:hypothetical protein
LAGHCFIGRVGYIKNYAENAENYAENAEKTYNLLLSVYICLADNSHLEC